jgi:hypothetical protein
MTFTTTNLVMGVVIFAMFWHSVKNSGLASQVDVAKLDWFITKNILRISFYKFSKEKLTQ